MKQFVNVVRMVKRILDGILIFNIVLNAIILFLFSGIILGLFGIGIYIAFIPTSIYFVLDVYFKIRINKNKLVEAQYEPIKEKLTTASDNINMENPIVEELQKEVINDLKEVRVSAFLHERKSSFKMIIIVILCFSAVLFSMVDAKINGFNLYVNNNPVFSQNRTANTVSNQVILADLNHSEDIYGDEDLAKLGNVELGIKVKPADFEVDIREDGEVKEKTFDETFPSEVYVESGSAYEEEIPVDQQELVKKYFKNIAQS